MQQRLQDSGITFGKVFIMPFAAPVVAPIVTEKWDSVLPAADSPGLFKVFQWNNVVWFFSHHMEKNKGLYLKPEECHHAKNLFKYRTKVCNLFFFSILFIYGELLSMRQRKEMRLLRPHSWGIFQNSKKLKTLFHVNQTTENLCLLLLFNLIIWR